MTKNNEVGAVPDLWVSEQLLKKLKEYPPAVLKEWSDETTDDAFCFYIPPKYAAVWVKALEERHDIDNRTIQTVVQHLRWYLNPTNIRRLRREMN